MDLVNKLIKIRVSTNNLKNFVVFEKNSYSFISITIVKIRNFLVTPVNFLVIFVVNFCLLQSTIF